MERKGPIQRTIDYTVNKSGELTYWDPISQRDNIMYPAAPITDSNIVIAKIGQQNLLPGHLTIKSKDFEETVVTDYYGNPIGNPVLPGISAFLFWGGKDARQDNLHNLTLSHLGREVSKKNRLYFTQVGDIYRAGWTPYYTPLIDHHYKICNPLHVILVPNTFQGTIVRQDAGEVEKEELVEAFLRWDNYGE